MTEFKKGQTIRAVRDTESAYGETFRAGDEVVATRYDSWSRPSHPQHTLGVSTVAEAAISPDSYAWLVNPADFEPAEPETEEVPIHYARDFRVGDVITVSEHSDSEAALPLIRVRREKAPEPPKPRPAQFGTADVDGYAGPLRGFLTGGTPDTPPVFCAPLPDGGYMHATGEAIPQFEPDAPPAPLDPSKVKAGDTVALERDGGRLPDQEVMAVSESGMGYTTVILRGGLQVYITGPDAWTLTAHQPAPEPEPYTPTRERVRQAYVDARVDTDLITESEAGAEFDRWLDSLGLTR